MQYLLISRFQNHFKKTMSRTSEIITECQFLALGTPTRMIMSPIFKIDTRDNISIDRRKSTPLRFAFL